MLKFLTKKTNEMLKFLIKKKENGVYFLFAKGKYVVLNNKNTFLYFFEKIKT